MELSTSSALPTEINFSADVPEVFAELFEPKRYKVYYGGRGGAKSWGFADALLILGTGIIEPYKRPLRILCARELQKSITDSVHKLLSDQIGNLGLQEFYDVQKTSILGLNGTEFMFNGLKHNATEIKSTEGIDICWVEEAERVSDASWELLIPTVRKEESEIWVSFNTKQPTDATYQRFIYEADEDSVVKKVSYRDNPFFPDVLEKERLRLFKKDPKAYEHVWEGEFDTRYSGSVYGKWVSKLKEQGRISPLVKHDPDFPVYTAWDLGFGDATAIWFYQMGGNEVFLIDYYENNQEGIHHYCEALHGREIIVDERDKKAGEVTAWHFGDDIPEHAHRREYSYQAHYAPHDAGYKIQAAGGRSIVSQAQRLGIKMYVIPATSVINGIDVLRDTLPICWINQEMCAVGIERLLHYHYEWDEDKGTYKKEPLHDKSSHGAKAAELMARMRIAKTATEKQRNTTKLEQHFLGLRRKHNVDKVDPYRVKPGGKKTNAGKV